MGCIVVKSKPTNSNGNIIKVNASANKIKSNLIKPTTQINPKTNNEGGTENMQRENSERAKNNNASKIIMNENKNVQHIKYFTYQKPALVNAEEEKTLEVYLYADFQREKRAAASKIIELKSLNSKTDKIDKNNNMILSDIVLEDDQVDLIKNSLSNHFIFRDLSEDIILHTISSFALVHMYPDTYLFKEGDSGNFFYLIKQGELELTLPNVEEKKYFKQGDSFGELALIQKNKRSGTVKSVGEVDIYCLEANIFKDIVAKLNNVDLKERIFFLNLIPIFNSLNNHQIQEISRYMIKCEFKKGHVIIQEGDIGESMYIIKEGTIVCSKNDREIRKLFVKDFFGTSSLLFQLKRSLTVTSANDSFCYQITKRLLIDILGGDFAKIILQGIAKNAISNVKMLKVLGIDEYFSKVFPLMKLSFYKNNEVVVNKHHYENRRIIIVVEGNLINSLTEGVVATRGELFGADLLKKKEVYKLFSSSKINLLIDFFFDHEILSASDCITMECLWNDVISNLNLNIDENKILNFLIRISQLKKLSIFKHLSENRLFDICKIMKKEHFKEGEIIFEDESPGNKLYLLYKGKVQVLKENKVLRELDKGSCFGEISLLLNQPHTATIKASTKVSLYTLSSDKFFKNMDKNILDFLIHKISLQDNFLTNLENLYYIKSLGEGKFGTVSLVHNEKHLYAIKAVNRKSAEQQKILIKYFLKERHILLKLDHPLVVKLVKTMKNEEYIFYLMEYVNGMVLSKYLENRLENRIRNKFETQFYVACLLIVVDYLNSKSIAHRDLKPDNTMIDEKGYLKVIDFGTAVIIKDFTNTITGTPHYIAPEVLLGRGYSFSADFWSVGILAFEIYFNYYPFGNKAIDPMEVYKDIIKKDLKFPGNVQDETIVNFIKKLLKKKVSERLCNLDQIKQDKFFEEFDFNELLEFGIKAPFLPDVSTTNHLQNTKHNYLEKLIKKKLKSSVLSSYVEDKNEDYDPNWADEF